MAVSDRPQERLERFGPRSLSNRELLAIILRSGQKGTDIVSLAGALLDKTGSLSRLMHWTRHDFMQIHGIGSVKAAQLVTVMELVRRVIQEWDSESSSTQFNSAETISQYFRSRIAGLDVEKFWVLCLDRKNRLIHLCEATSGTATGSLVHPREVFRDAIRINATAIIIAHNHPSGDPAPSQADIQITKQLNEAARTINIDLLDHVILGKRANDSSKLGFYSFRDTGLL